MKDKSLHSGNQLMSRLFSRRMRSTTTQLPHCLPDCHYKQVPQTYHREPHDGPPARPWTAHRQPTWLSGEDVLWDSTCQLDPGAGERTVRSPGVWCKRNGFFVGIRPCASSAFASQSRVPQYWWTHQELDRILPIQQITASSSRRWSIHLMCNDLWSTSGNSPRSHSIPSVPQWSLKNGQQPLQALHLWPSCIQWDLRQDRRGETPSGHGHTCSLGKLMGHEVSPRQMWSHHNHQEVWIKVNTFTHPQPFRITYYTDFKKAFSAKIM